MRIARYYWNNKSFQKSAVEMCYSERPNVMFPHSHEKLELTYFYDTCECEYICAGKKLYFKGGELAVVNPYEVHSSNNWGKNCKLLCIIIDLKKLNIPSLLKLCYANKISNDKELINIFYSIKKVLFSTDISDIQKECQVNSLVYSLLGEISKYSLPEENRPTTKLSEVFEFIDKNLSYTIRVSDLAEILHLSADRFYHVFKELTGLSPTEYILARRIDKACYYLENSDMKIVTIAQECNFCTASYFTEKFKVVMNMTPNQYRKRYCNYMCFSK